mgnify:CR=1 FL=1|jgi:D-beta-D-heptose 7-phosphate kinase/D-beta-D-heptose 1-phosphate adenosyltransferase|tara:strand:+ start:400 stop:807 length:408 start_codon:yes stop_codon:yes gene_type:complete
MKYIMVNGAYDILHVGHIDLINYAKSLGDYLLVALDTDERIAYNKGKDRPVNDLYTRMMIMKNIRSVDEVRSFNSDRELIDIFKDYRPDKRVIGSDWQGKTIVGREYSGEIIFYERKDENSTTKTLENYVNRRRM